MKILAFSHLTFCLPEEVKSFGKDIFGNGTEVRVQNHANKKIFMKGQSSAHYLYWNKIGIEVTSYLNTRFNHPDSRNLAYKFLTDYASAPYQVKICYSPEFISFLNEFGKLEKIEKNSFLFKGVGVFKDFKIFNDCASPFSKPNQYLDEAGFSGIAVYTDSVAEDMELAKTLAEVKSQPYEVWLRNRKFQVQFIRIGGVNIELLSRN